MGRTLFNPQNPDLDVVRQILLERLRKEPDWNSIDHTGTGFTPYVEYEGTPSPEELAFLSLQVFWQLIIEGILAPGQ